MATTHVTGWESDAGASSEGAAGKLRRRAHAVLRRHADEPPPWVSECGAPVSEIRGSWPPVDEAGLEVACPACLSRLAV